MIRISLVALFTLLFITCEDEKSLTFSEENAVYNANAKVEINIPVAEGDELVSQKINKKIENHMANMLVFSEEDSPTLQLSEAITIFESEYLKFKNDFKETNLVFDATFDGEVIYQSPEVISIALTSYINTGGAHGNSNITLFNFNPETGNVLGLQDVIGNVEEFKQLAEIHFKNEILNNDKGSMEDYFFGKDFHLPANIGFNDDGVLLLYNPYEVAAYAMGITEFTIPFEEATVFLKVH